MPREAAVAMREAVAKENRAELMLERTAWNDSGFVNVQKIGNKFRARLQVPGDGRGGNLADRSGGRGLLGWLLMTVVFVEVLPYLSPCVPDRRGYHTMDQSASAVDQSTPHLDQSAPPWIGPLRSGLIHRGGGLIHPSDESTSPWINPPEVDQSTLGVD